MAGLPVLPLIALGLLLFAAPLVLLILLLYVVTLRLAMRRVEARLTELERQLRDLVRLPPVAAGVPVTAAAGSPPAARLGGPVESGAAEPTPAGPVPAPGPAAVEPAAVAAGTPSAGALSVAGPGPTGAAGAGIGSPAPGAPSEPLPAHVPAAAAAPGGPATERAPSEPGAPGGRVTPWEGRVGSAWLSRVGALLVILGVAFFLKHAFESDWIGPAGRVAIGLLLGILLIAGGGRLARRGAYWLPAHSLIALGIGVLYLSLYAAHAFHRLVPALPAFLAMAAVTAIGVTIAAWLDGRALAALAVLGGLLTPPLLGGEPEGATLFPYLAILAAGVLLLAVRRGWFGLALFTWAGAQILYWTWVERGPVGSASVPTALGWATAFFVAFAAVALRGSRVARSPDTRELSRSLLVLGAPAAYYLAARRFLDEPGGRRLAVLALGLAVAYAVAARVAARSPRAGPRSAVLHGAVAVGCLAVAPAAVLARHALTIAWSVEGLVLLWGGFGLGSVGLRAGGLALQTLASGRWFAALGEDPGQAGPFLLAHPALPATVAVAGTAALGAVGYRLAGPRAALRDWERPVRPILTLVAIGTAALQLTVELSQFRTLVIPPPYVPVTTSVVWMVAGVMLLALARGDRTRVIFAAVSALLVTLIGHTLGDAPAWNRIPLALRPAVGNPRFLAGCLLVVLTWLYGQVSAGLPYLAPRTRRWVGVLGAAAAALLLLWNLSVEVWLAPLPATRYDPGKLRSAALSILWAVYAVVAMAWGLWRGWTGLRVGAIVLFGVTALKVLLVDLADLDALYRILSVLVLGAALLLASVLYARARQRPRESA
ncbi:MAG TPA: DUF2339 domain-containing protein [Methylomirabilota bacterium]|nr:DUF2339 domain-containing protein [Methylomirabilota bacterium]